MYPQNKIGKIKCFQENVGKAILKLIHYANWIDQDSALRVLTSQFFGAVYYAAPVWLSNLTEAHWQRFHYRSIRAAVCGYTRKIRRAVFSIIAKWATPKQWSHNAVAKCVINLYNSSATRIRKFLRDKSYINDRNPGKAVFFSNTWKKARRTCIISKLHFFNEITFDWVGDISEDTLRKSLNKQFINFFYLFIFTRQPTWRGVG